MNVPSLLGDRLNELFGEENHPLVLLETSLGIHWVTLGFSTSINQAISQPPGLTLSCWKSGIGLYSRRA